MTTLLILLLQLGSATLGDSAAVGPKSLWELTLSGEGGRTVKHTACEAQLIDDERYIKRVDEMDPAGARCTAPVLTRNPMGWVREKTCTETQGTVVIRASRRGDPLSDVTYATELSPPGGKPSWSISTRMRRLGPCPGEPEEPKKGPTRCPARSPCSGN
jgi:hypothetical protein